MKRKILLSLFIVFLIVTMTVIDIYAVSLSANYYTGLEPDSYEEIMKIMDKSNVTRSLPSSVDNTSLFPSPGNQGSQSSCVAWAIGYALKSNVEYNKRNWTVSESRHQFSPAYIYNQLVKPDSENKNTSILKTLELIEDEGVCPLTYFPYNSQDYTTQPNEIQRAAASLYKGLTYYAVFGINNIKNRIAQGDGVVIGIKTYPDFNNISSSNQVYDSTSGKFGGNHAICLIGYDDNKDGGAFKFINSWGTSWGMDGYGWIDYDLVNSLVNVQGIGVGFYMTSPATDDYLIGDINGNGIINSEDARLALRYSVNLETPTAIQFVLADVDGNAVISASDAREITQYSTGLIDNFSLYD